MKKKRKLTAILVLLAVPVLLCNAQTSSPDQTQNQTRALPGTGARPRSAEEIVQRADEAMDYESAYMEARMVNTDQFGPKTIAYRAWGKDRNFLIEFTSDAEYGQKILRTEDRIYHFFPEAETIFTRGKGDTIVGLISYEDMTEESDMLDIYNVQLEGEERLGGTPCFRVLMEVKKGKRTTYPIERVWIEKDTWIVRRLEMFTRGGKPLKTMEIREVKNFGGTLMAVNILLTDEVRPGVRSEIFIDEADLNREIPDSMFTRRELTR